ncbi:MAG: hypothetical protein AB7U86_12450 [Methylocystis sp.]|uniref:hypothetical protein n=1 Tax=Methylocystis sp. TaxID=1911079 RepID=UPI003D1512F7
MANKKDKDSFGGSLAKGVIQGATAAAVKFVLPFVGAAMTFIAGYLGNMPWMWVIMATCVAFGGASGGLLWFGEWLDKRRVEGKLTFSQALVARDIQGNGIVIGARVTSAASFPLEFEVTEIRTRLGTTVPVTQHSSKRFEIPPSGIGWYYDHPISIPNPPKPGALEGFLEFRLRYGRVGSSLPFNLNGKKQIVAEFDKQGIYTNGIWQEAN